MKKRLIQKTRAYFLILHLVLSIIAFNILLNVSFVSAGPVTTATPGTSVSPISSTTKPTTLPIPGGLSVVPTATSTAVPNTNVNPTGDVIPTTDGGLSGGTTPTVPTPGGSTGGTTGTGGGTTGGGGGIDDILNVNVQAMVTKAGLGASIFGTIGSLAGGDNGYLYGALSGTIGGIVSALSEKALGQTKSLLLGLGVATVIFVLTYKKTSKETVEFNCLPWEAPTGGDDCSKCNELEECSEYTCKSLGQACEIINSGTTEQKCFWKNPSDVNSPIITMLNVTKGHKFSPDGAVRPPTTGVKITSTTSTDGCVKAFTALAFTFETSEPAQCKVDYNLTKTFDDMSYYVGGESIYVLNHTEQLSLPSPESVKNISAPEIKNDGAYTLFVRCKDANGNFNQDAFSISFCVQSGPDTTPPVVVSTSLSSGSPVQYNKSSLLLDVYVNEPSECKWSHEDRSYKNMENQMDCDTNVWEMNNQQVYTCRANLTGIENRKENNYYFRCKDQPSKSEGDRNENKQSYKYTLVGSQPLNIIEVIPNGNETVSGSTDTIPVYLEVYTDNGYNNGEASCYYSATNPTSSEDYIQFLETGKNTHKQRQDLPAGTYKYYFKCIDLGGNAVYNSTTFKVVSDKSAPVILRVYRESGELKIVTDEESTCSYSTKDCNFEIDSGVAMNPDTNLGYTSEWMVNSNMYIRCKDKYDNQPNPNTCSITVRPSKLDNKSETISLA